MPEPDADPTPLAELRTREGLTMSELGQALGVDAATASRWIKNGAPSVVRTAMAAASNLGCTVEQMFGEKPCRKKLRIKSSPN